MAQVESRNSPVVISGQRGAAVIEQEGLESESLNSTISYQVSDTPGGSS